jgi:hypothetical protein
MKGIFCILVVAGLMWINYPQTAYSTGVAPATYQSVELLNTVEMKEIWKPVKGYEGLYEVSNLGRVKSLERPIYRKCGRLHYTQKELILSTKRVGSHGYRYLNLCNRVQKAYTVHRLMMEAFIPNPENKKDINHIDGNKLNNVLSNLEWATRSENMVHMYKTGLRACNKYKPVTNS